MPGPSPLGAALVFSGGDDQEGKMSELPQVHNTRRLVEWRGKPRESAQRAAYIQSIAESRGISYQEARKYALANKLIVDLPKK